MLFLFCSFAGDSGYPLEPWLLTPIANAVTNNQREYNRRHKTLRNTVERTNGVLKQRFRCCLKHRTLHYSPIRAAKIIYSCAIIHNLCVDRNEYLDDLNGNLFLLLIIIFYQGKKVRIAIPLFIRL